MAELQQISEVKEIHIAERTAAIIDYESYLPKMLLPLVRFPLPNQGVGTVFHLTCFLLIFPLFRMNIGVCRHDKKTDKENVAA